MTVWNSHHRGVNVLRLCYLHHRRRHKNQEETAVFVARGLGQKMFPKDESLDDESDRISFCQLFGDLVMF